MEFMLTGFRQDNNVRRYTFQGIDTDRKRSEFTVGVDLSLVRKYRIPMQELPLLCRGVLQSRSLAGSRRSANVQRTDVRRHARVYSPARG